MTLLQKLQAHRGGLIRLPTQLFWYWPRGRGWDSTPGRLCLLLDVTPITAHPVAGAAPAAAATVAATVVAAPTVAPWDAAAAALTLLLIDGHPRWVRVVEGDVELL